MNRWEIELFLIKYFAERIISLGKHRVWNSMKSIRVVIADGDFNKKVNVNVENHLEFFLFNLLTLHSEDYELFIT